MKAERNWEAGWYEEEDKPGILAINRAEYGDVPLSQEPYFDWLQTQNPTGRPIIPVAREKGTGKVVAFLFLVPMRISWSGEARRALVGMNVVVGRAYRRQRIWQTIRMMAINEGKKRGYDFFYGLPNRISLRGFRKWNYKVVTQVLLIIRPLDIVTLTKTRVNSRVLQWAANLGWKVAAATIWSERRPVQNGLFLTMLEDAEFDESYDRFWDRIKRKYDLMLIRDRAFLQWRFQCIPYRTYEVLSARQAADILGYVVLRRTEISGTPCGLIVDFLVVPGERGNQVGLRLLHEATERFKQAQLALSGGLMLPHTQEFSIMQRAGYLPCPQRFAPQPFHLVVENLSEGIPPEVLTWPEAWYVSIADHDAA